MWQIQIRDKNLFKRIDYMCILFIDEKALWNRVLFLREQPLVGQHGRIKNFAVLCLWFLESTYVVNSWAPEFIWGHDIFRTWRWAKQGGTLWDWLSSWDVDGIPYVLSFPLFSRPLFTRIVSHVHLSGLSEEAAMKLCWDDHGVDAQKSLPGFGTLIVFSLLA